MGMHLFALSSTHRSDQYPRRGLLGSGPALRRVSGLERVLAEACLDSHRRSFAPRERALETSRDVQIQEKETTQSVQRGPRKESTSMPLLTWGIAKMLRETT